MGAASAASFDKRCELGVAVAVSVACITAWIFLLRSIISTTRTALSSSSSLPLRFRLRDLHPSPSLHPHAPFAPSGSASLPDGSLVSILRLNRLRRPRESAFLADLAAICSLRHECLANVQGWCLERGEAMLFYAFLPWSLEARLFGGVGGGGLGAEARMKILRKVGEAVAYMHDKGFLHTGVGLENVVLGEGCEDVVQITGAGVARLVANDSAEWAKMPHVAPEIRYTGKATAKADVYSFGILALQLACGRRIVHGDFHLLPWLWLLHNNRVDLAEAIDRSILTSPPSSSKTSSSASSLPPLPLPQQHLSFSSSSSSPSSPVVPHPSHSSTAPSTLPLPSQLSEVSSEFTFSSSSSTSIHAPAISSALPLPVSKQSTPPLSSAMDYHSSITVADDSVPDSELHRWLCVLHLALHCCHPLIEARPSMRQALMILDENRILPLPPSLHDSTCWGFDPTAEGSLAAATEST